MISISDEDARKKEENLTPPTERAMIANAVALPMNSGPTDNCTWNVQR